MMDRLGTHNGEDRKRGKINHLGGFELATYWLQSVCSTTATAQKIIEATLSRNLFLTFQPHWPRFCRVKGFKSFLFGVKSSIVKPPKRRTFAVLLGRSQFLLLALHEDDVVLGRVDGVDVGQAGVRILKRRESQVWKNCGVITRNFQQYEGNETQQCLPD